MGGRREGGRRKKGRRGNENRTWGHVPRAPRSSARFLRPSPRVVQNAGEPALKVGADSRITRQRRSRPLRAGVSAKKKKIHGTFLFVLGPDFLLPCDFHSHRRGPLRWKH